MIQRIKHITKRLLGRTGRERSPLLEEFSDKMCELERLYQMRLEHIIPINQSLLMISQLPRSGGSLLSQLFDGHRECHTHPHELYIGFPKRYRWPDLDLTARAEVWFEYLFERRTLRFYRKGYRKNPAKLYDSLDLFPFFLLPNLQKEIFMKQVAQTEISSQRDVLNCYMTSYFNAWLDYQELYRPNKKYLVAFSPRLDRVPEELKCFFEDDINAFFKDYPKGKVLSIIRDPKTWYISARRHPYYKDRLDLQLAMALWKTSVETMLINKRRFGNQVYLLCFESLLEETEGTIRTLAKYLDLTFDESLLKPTFQGMDIRANSVDRVEKRGIVRTPLNRAQELNQDEMAYIQAETQKIYETALFAVG